MTKKLFKLSTILILAALLLAACGQMPGAGGADGTPTALPPVVSAGEIVVDGRIVPDESVELAFNTSGEIAEVLVQEGDSVQAGDVIARLGNRETLESNVSKANLDILSAQQEQLDAEQARQELFDTLSIAQTNALQELNDARQALKDADRKVAGLRSDPSQADLEEAEATLILTKDKLTKAEKDYKEYENRSEKNLIRARCSTRFPGRAAITITPCAATTTSSMAGPNLAAPRRRQSSRSPSHAWRKPRKTTTSCKPDPIPTQLALAEKRIETATGRISAAETALAAAQAALADLDLVATIPGTVTRLDLIDGQRVSPGEVVAQIADFSKWYVETDNLTEIDVVDVAVGQNATVTPDALPELVLSGVVEKISDNFEEKRGDITYTARILLNEVDPRLRWGMTTVVKFEK